MVIATYCIRCSYLRVRNTVKLYFFSTSVLKFGMIVLLWRPVFNWNLRVTCQGFNGYYFGTQLTFVYVYWTVTGREKPSLLLLWQQWQTYLKDRLFPPERNCIVTQKLQKKNLTPGKIESRRAKAAKQKRLEQWPKYNNNFIFKQPQMNILIFKHFMRTYVQVISKRFMHQELWTE